MKKASWYFSLAIPLVASVLTIVAHAQTFSVLYGFKGGVDGAIPQAALVRDSSGNLYSTTRMGGDTSCAGGCGTVFKIDASGTLATLHLFSGEDGAYLVSGLLRSVDGTLYSTAWQGGSSGSGNVFALDGSGTETVLHSFSGTGPDGGLPLAGLIRDNSGNFYGTASANTRQSGLWGNVFKVDSSGNETVLYTFKGKPDGAIPKAGLIRDAAGNLYGTTWSGGSSNLGTVFKLDTAGNETVLHNFSGGTGDGAHPYTGLVRDASGNLYGTTYNGGSVADTGIVFKLDAGGKITVLHHFMGSADGANPYAGLLRDASGNLYGTALYGGAHGKGTVFKLDATGRLMVLHNFAGGVADGENPGSGLIMDAQHNLYGTTWAGGGGTQCGLSNGCGTVFKLSLP